MERKGNQKSCVSSSLPMPIHTDSTLHVCTRHINRNIQVHIISHDNGPHTPTGT